MSITYTNLNVRYRQIYIGGVGKDQTNGEKKCYRDKLGLNYFRINSSLKKHVEINN
jgi:hypothetical protein